MSNDIYKKLIAALKRHGCTIARQAKGSHEFWQSPINNQKFSVPIGTKSRHTANAILKQAGIEEKI